MLHTYTRGSEGPWATRGATSARRDTSQTVFVMKRALHATSHEGARVRCKLAYCGRNAAKSRQEVFEENRTRGTHDPLTRPASHPPRASDPPLLRKSFHALFPLYPEGVQHHGNQRVLPDRENEIVDLLQLELLRQTSPRRVAHDEVVV